MLIPHTSIDPATLDELLSDFATRDGTDNGHFTSLEHRKAELRRALSREDIFITFNHEYLQPCLLAKHQASVQALAEFAKLKEDLSRDGEELEAQHGSEAEFHTLFNRLQRDGMFPLSLGRTTQSRAVNTLRQSGVIRLSDLQSMLQRHASGDFGMTTWCEKMANLNALSSKQAICSRYSSAGFEFQVDSFDGYLLTLVSIAGEQR